MSITSVMFFAMCSLANGFTAYCFVSVTLLQCYLRTLAGYCVSLDGALLRKLTT